MECLPPASIAESMAAFSHRLSLLPVRFPASNTSHGGAGCSSGACCRLHSVTLSVAWSLWRACTGQCTFALPATEAAEEPG